MSTANTKNNLIVDFGNTMQSWVADASPFEDGYPQAVDVASSVDPIRRDYGALWSPRAGSWQYGFQAAAPAVAPTPGNRAPNALIDTYSYRNYRFTPSVPSAPPQFDFSDQFPSNPSVSDPRPLVEQYDALSEAQAEEADRLGTPAAISKYIGPAPFGFIRQRIKIKANRDLLPDGGAMSPMAADLMAVSPQDEQAWRNWCIQNYYGRNSDGPDQGYYKYYYDHCTTYYSPFTPLEQRTAGDDRLASSVNFEYNFYIQQYEQGIDQLPVSSHTLYPHLYTMYFEKSRAIGLTDIADVPPAAPMANMSSYNEDYLYHDFVTLNRSLEGVFVNTLRLETYDSFTDSAVERTEKAGERDRGEYFNRWMSQYTNLFNPLPGSPAPASTLPGIQTIRQKYRNMLLTKNAATEAPGYNIYRRLFPMYSQINLPLTPATFMGYSAGATGQQVGANISELGATARVWDGYYAVRHGGDSNYVSEVKFAENHQSGDQVLATQDNLANGTSRTVFNLGDLIYEMSTGGSEGVQINYADNLASFRAALGATQASPIAGGVEIDTNDEEATDERVHTYGLAQAQFLARMDEFLEDATTQYLRSYTEILEGAKAFSCNFLYRINKFERTGNSRGSRVQSIFIPQYTTDANDIINFIDTQLKYSKTYEYEILTYRAVIGSKYRFTELYLPTFDEYGIPSGDIEYYGPATFGRMTPAQRRVLAATSQRITSEPDTFAGASDPPARSTEIPSGYGSEPPRLDASTSFSDNPFFAEIDVAIEPSIVVVELPYISSQQPWMPEADQSFGIGSCIDNPGISPNVQVIPYRGVSNRVLFNLGTGVGRQLRAPIALDNSEAQYLQGVYQNQGLDPSGKVLYASDDPARRFEIYRLDYLPASYEQFSGNRIANISTSNKLLGYRSADSVSFVDDVSSNRRYYYMFRSFDIHGHPSHPSEIYEIELIDDDGAVFPRVRVVDPASGQNNRVSQKNLQRFLQIKPQLSQRLFNAEETFAPLDQEVNSSAPVADTIVLGYEAEKIWDKRFKIRLTSKKSGKKIDLNLCFKKEYSDQRSDSGE